ncbi:uncharacterized protein BCR38DRAFT_332628 [Pseudomassariella vexata]|uniref:Serine/threonine-protein kinase ppk6 n=1 Tax=Pseudomassariella vexata TaxID=1141098 RepID=A0A1Y2EFD2_9PEZI|nr:uncharacterized protein BCR38DRAFT_332628 [Pseudomassariella vexata]ORY70117.1 hypothetical protein BCR38DRAFT_332628 [Pseudomassariella vexata]
MSADLFNEFAQPKPSQRPSPQNSHPSFTAEPFSFSPTTSASQPIQHIDPFFSASLAPVKSEGQQSQQPWPALQQTTNPDPWGSLTESFPAGISSQNKVNNDDDDDDGWGDFESADNSSKPTPQPLNAAPQTLTASYSSRKPLQHPAIGRTRIVRAPTIELMTNSLIDIPGLNNLPDEVRSPPWMRTSFEQQKKQAPKVTPPKPPFKSSTPDPNVLFDADDFAGKADNEDEGDDFGDFEIVASPAGTTAGFVTNEFGPPAKAKRNPPQLLSALNLNGPVSPYPQAPKSPSFHDRNPFPGLGVKTPTELVRPADNPQTSPITAWPTLDNRGSAGSTGAGDDWGAFDDFLDDPRPSKDCRDSKDADGNWDWDADDIKSPESAKSRPSKTAARSPPTNIPPPSILLSIFPQLIGEANTFLYKPVGGQAFPIKNRILSDPKTIEYLRGYLLLATVAARIIAGRKLRWHRDKFLSQSMSISAAGSKGMKLAGIDKTQAAREDREAADIMDIWKENIGRLRSSIAAANTSTKNTAPQLKIPGLQENMPIQTAKAVPTAPKACFICGLKRDERVLHVDHEVEDSFGEWWSDHWGHTTCKRFWLEHEVALRQR